jgi:hypothetical protein
MDLGRLNCFADNFPTPAGSNCQFLCSRVHVLWSEPTKIGHYKNRAVAVSCYRTFQLALAEYSTATADHRYVQTQPAVGDFNFDFYPCPNHFYYNVKIAWVSFGMLSEHKNWQFEVTGVRKLSAKQFSSGLRGRRRTYVPGHAILK